MKIKNYCLAATMLMGAALSAFGQATVVANPSSFTFNLGTAGSQEQKLVLTLSTGQNTVLTVTPSYVLINGSAQSQSVVTGNQITISPAPNASSAVSGSISVSGQGVTTASIPVTFTGTGSGGGGSAAFQVDKTTLSYYQAVGGQPPPAQTINITSNLGVVPNYSTTLTYASGTLTGWVQAYQYANQVQVYITGTQSLPQGTYTAYLTLTPIAGSAVTIPINLYVGTGNPGGTGSFLVTPNPISFNYLPGTTPPPQTVTVSTTPNAVFTVTPSANLQGIISVSPNPAQANALGTATLTVTNLSNFQTSGVTGTLTFSGNTLLSTDVPVQINSGGATSGGLTYTPASLTFNVAAGSTTAPPSQTVQIISADFATKFFSASVQTPGSSLPFVVLQQSSPTTPATLTVSINPQNLPSLVSGNTYTSTITLATTTGVGGFASIPVTVVVGTGTGGGGGSGTGINVDPASVSLSGKAGDTYGPQALVQLSVPGGGDPGYVSTVTTSTGGNWLSVQPPAGTMTNRVTIGADVKNLAAGTYTGEVTFSSTGNVFVKLPVTLTVTGSGTLTLAPKTLTFSHQLTNSSAPAAQTVQITGTGATLNWSALAKTTTGSGWLQVSPTSGTTPGTVSVSVTPSSLAAGTYNGSVDITSAGATNSPQTIDVVLVVTSAPTPQIRTAVNGASFIAGPVAAGEILTLTGTDLGPTPGVGVQGNNTSIATTLGGVQVRFDGIAAPLLYVSASQINLVVPFEVAGRTSTRVEVEYQGIKSSQLELAVAPSAPGVFTQTATGTGPGAILNQNGTVNRAGNPENAGNVIVIYATGFGQLSPPPATGAVIPGTGAIPRPVLPVRVKIGGVESEVIYAGAAPGFVAGAIQLNVRIPLGTNGGTTGTAPVQVQVGDQGTAALVTVAVP